MSKYYDINKLLDDNGIDKKYLFFIAPKDYGKNYWAKVRNERKKGVKDDKRN